MKNLTTLLPVGVIIVLVVFSFLIVQSSFFANKERRIIPQTQNITPQVQDVPIKVQEITPIIRDISSEFFSKEGRICIQVITSAKNPLTGECKEFPTPCDVPEGWQKVEKCD